MSDALIDAIEAMKWTPEQLTREQLQLLTKADPDLGARARTRHQDAKTRAFAEQVAADIKRAVDERVQVAVHERVAPLEARVLELEATQAAQAATPVGARDDR
jgi:hypothetical protein